NSCSQERQTWKSLSHANANGERIVPCMITSYSLCSPPTPPSTRLLASSGALETHLTLYKVGDRQHLSRMHVRLGSLLERITSGMSSWLAGSTQKTSMSGRGCGIMRVGFHARVLDHGGVPAKRGPTWNKTL